MTHCEDLQVNWFDEKDDLCPGFFSARVFSKLDKENWNEDGKYNLQFIMDLNLWCYYSTQLANQVQIRSTVYSHHVSYYCIPNRLTQKIKSKPWDILLEKNTYGLLALTTQGELILMTLTSS